MRILFRAVVPVVLLLVLTSVPALAQSKIATVDLRKLFDNYYKKKLADADLQQRRTELDKTFTDMAADFKKHNDDYQALLASANDQAVSEDERDRRRAAAGDDAKRLGEEKAAVEQFERQEQVELSDQADRMRQNILADIKKTVADKAKAAGDTMVFDTGAQSLTGTPAILYNVDDNDLTDDVLKQLNADAPPDLPDLNTATPTLLSTNSVPSPDLQVPSSGTGIQ